MKRLSRRQVVWFGLLNVLSGASAYPQTPSKPVHVLTFHNDNQRLGWNRMETLLKPGNVRPASFGKLWQTPLDGFVNGQPLYVSGLKINEKRYNVVIAATDTNSIYALDSETGKILWERKSVVPPVTGGQFNGAWNSREFHGILSTPVIDLPNHTLYTCLPHARGLKQVYEFWAIDIRNGSVKPGFPVEVKARDGKAVFKAGQCMQRGALTLEEGWVYAPFGGRGDVPPWRGWIIGINTRQPSAPQRAFCGSPVSDGAGIWSGGGISVSPNGDLFAVTGNGDYDFDKGGNNLGQSVIRLRNSSDKLAFSRTKRDIYTPRNFRFLDEQDEDLGGATALILPPLQNSSTPNLLFTGGKDGCAYLLNRDDLGGIGGELQRTRLFSQEDAPYHEGIRATPAYFDSGSNGRFLYVSGDQPGPDNNLGLMAVRLTTEGVGGPARFQKQWSHNRYMERPGAPVVSSNGQWDGIVWVTELGPDEDESQGSIQAFDALTGEMIYHSDQDTIRDRIGGTRKFVSPTVANGRVFVGIRGIACFGINVPEKGNE